MYSDQISDIFNFLSGSKTSKMAKIPTLVKDSNIHSERAPMTPTEAKVICGLCDKPGWSNTKTGPGKEGEAKQSTFEHPIEQPSLNQRHDWPTLHPTVPFAQLQPQPSVN